MVGTSTDELIATIDSTQHPEVTLASKVLDRSLLVLQIARTAHGIDGLTPSAIAKILTEKFRVNTTGLLLVFPVHSIDGDG